MGCGLVLADGALKGDVDHPANFGRLCSKGAALKESLDLPDRLLVPSIGGRETDWNEALDTITKRFCDVIRNDGPDAVAFYVSGQLLTEDYYVANKLMKGFIGSANIDTNSRLCMASSVAGHIRAFGEDVVPGCYEDIDETDLAILVGSNMAWCHPVLFQRLMAARERRGTRIVVIDPRRTATCEGVDLHLPLRAGSDISLFNGLLTYLEQTGTLNCAWIANHISGFVEAMDAAQRSAPTIDAVASATGLFRDDLLRFYDLFARTERVVTLYSQGVNQSAVGTDKVNAILNCHLATGRIGREGMGPLSLTGQPNAMGGREVGGLANQLAAHMAFEPADVHRVQRFWNAPNIATRPGLKAVDMFKAVGDGRVKAIWIAATNPAASMPDANHVRGALQTCPFVVVSDAWATDTSARADIVLPAATWAEKEGTVTNSERRISRQRAFRSPPTLARPDWWMFAEVARRMGWRDSFSYDNPAAIFREHAALSAFENEGVRMFDIGALAELDDEGYDTLSPVLWPCVKRRAQAGPQRLFANGGFPTPDRRACMMPVSSRADGDKLLFPLTLNTGRIRDQWHTMTRTGKIPRLMTHVPEPQLAIHPSDAETYGVRDNDLVCVESTHGSLVMRAAVTEAQRRGDVFMPMHWTDEFSSAGVAARLVHDETDRISGQPDLKGSKVRVSAVHALWAGLLLRRTPDAPRLGNSVYWSKTTIESGFVFDLAGWSDLASVIHAERVLRHLLQIPPEAELVSYSDPKRLIFRYAGLANGRLEACLSLAPSAAGLLARETVAPSLGRTLDPADRLALLAGHRSGVSPRPDKIVCACFAIGEERLTAAIEKKNLKSVHDIGAALGAGTNCGSCIPELKRILKEPISEGTLLTTS